MVQTGTKIVKRYANRKLYDTEESKYMTLKEIASAVLSGRDVQVIDNVTKGDITGKTLAMVLLETDEDMSGQTNTLRDILKAGGLSKYVANLSVKVGGNG